MEKIAVLIVDDHKLVGEIWSYMINADERFRVVAVCGTAAEGIASAKALKPDIILMDINLPDQDGAEATRQIRIGSPRSHVLAVTAHTHPSYTRNMLSSGARGYVTKNTPKEELFHAMLEVIKGRQYICTQIRDIIAMQVLTQDERQPSLNHLSSRELEIVELVRKGLSSREIAAQLHITTKTVEVHRYNVLKKLKLKNTAALVAFSRQLV